MKKLLEYTMVSILTLVIFFIFLLCYGLVKDVQASGSPRNILPIEMKPIEYCKPVIYKGDCKYEFTGYSQEK